jgi:hypothetical protein
MSADKESANKAGLMSDPARSRLYTMLGHCYFSMNLNAVHGGRRQPLPTARWVWCDCAFLFLIDERSGRGLTRFNSAPA